MILSRLGWTVWALVPVALVTYHFGPGQQLWNEDKAARIVARAEHEQDSATALQETAYQAHLRAIAARAAATGTSDPALNAAVRDAEQEEERTASAAKSAWAATAETIQSAKELVGDGDPALRDRLRLAHARASVRAGQIAAGTLELEDLLESAETPQTQGSPLVLAAREELATAYYYGARLMRMAGKPTDEWRELSGLARQNYRYLSERARATGGDPQSAIDLERNGELVLNLEQSSIEQLLMRPRPKDCPGGNCNGGLPGKQKKKGKGKRPGEQPSNGAGMNGEIGDGW